MVDRICRSLLSDDSLRSSFNNIFLASKADENDEAEGQVQMWLWDMTGDFKLDRAVALLRFAGIVV